MLWLILLLPLPSLKAGVLFFVPLLAIVLPIVFAKFLVVDWRSP